MKFTGRVVAFFFLLFSFLVVEILTAREEIETVGVNAEAGDGVEVSNHRVHQLARMIVEEPDLAIFITSDSEGQRGMGDDAIHLAMERTAGGVWKHKFAEGENAKEANTDKEMEGESPGQSATEKKTSLQDMMEI